MSRCAHCPLTRRQFLRATGAIAVWTLLPAAEPVFAGAPPESRTPIFAKSKPRVTLLFSHVPPEYPTWPSVGYDYEGRKRELTAKLQEACPNILFTVRTAHNTQQAEAVVKESENADGFVCYNIGIWTGAPNVLVRSGKPVVMVDDLFAGSGETLIIAGVANREKLPVVTVSSSRFEDVVEAVRLFEVIRAMKESTILDIADYDITAWAGGVNSLFGTKVVKMGSEELASYYSRADEAEAARWADLWIKQAKKVVEPSREEIIKSGKMYLALAQAAADKRADAVTMDCLGMFYSGRVTAYPCLSHFQMNNDGGTGVCEADLNSTCTQLMMRYLTGRPGYVSDPVIDTSRGWIIYAHCVASNRVFGPQGKANPYIIRSHAEDAKGASVQSLMPIGETVTTLEIDVMGKRMVIHTGKTVANVDDPKACRTKLAAKTDAQNILNEWDMGWHRVTVYGDWRRQAINLARLYGLTVNEEDKPG
ncbi:MAG: hypothetical protein HPY54_10845 [Chthonomonadetes bacterium]|nr:hypothetical protein [Chthonomonadetes bacterium]